MGAGRSFRIALDIFALELLRKLYGFDPWHAQAPLSARPYRHVVAEMVNDLAPINVVEVGCGLGATLKLVHAKYRSGYDIDAAVIRAARLLRGRGIRFASGDMTSIVEPHVDVLILVNWIHDISPQQLEAWLSPLLLKTDYLLLDAIDADNPLNYQFKHDFAFLADRAQVVSEKRSVGEGRRFILYKVNS